MPNSQRAANVQNCGKEADMNSITKQKITILYERLSVEDDRDTESQSIENQRNILQDYAKRHGLIPYIHIAGILGDIKFTWIPGGSVVKQILFRRI